MAELPQEVTVEGLLALGPMASRLRQAVPDLARRPGVTATRPRGQGHEIREIRPFLEGDDPRHLDPGATARTGSLQVRSFHEDRDRTVMLIADFRRPMLWGTLRMRSVAAAEVLALAGWMAVRAGGSVAVAALTDGGIHSERPASRDRGMARIAGCLARAHVAALAATVQPIRDLSPDLMRAARLAPRGATVVVATALDQPGIGLETALGEILRRGPLRLLRVTDPFEADPPRRSLPFLTASRDFARGSFRELHTRRAETLARLAKLGVSVEEVAAERGAADAA